MKIWILLGIVVLLLLLGLRESFKNYEEALKDVGQTAGYTSLAPKCPEGSSLNAEKTMCKFTDTKKADVVPTCSSDTLEFVGGVCKPKAGMGTTSGSGTTSGTTGGIMGGTTSGIMGGTTTDMTSMKDAICSDGSKPSSVDMKCPDGKSPCPSGSTLVQMFPNPDARALSFPKCVSNTISTYPMKPLPSRPDPNFKLCDGDDALISYPGKPFQESKCVRKGNTTTSETTMSAMSSSTGGSSTSSFGPNSGGGGNRRQQVFGPMSNGRDMSSGVRPVDSSKSKIYPELLGGNSGRESTRIEGAGITSPSTNWQLSMSGTLPSSLSLGSDENSKFFPFSRQPGDMELIPDPYRVSQQFSSASYSFKTEPTPFLTDFSAFYS